ncbi:MAG: ABC transporter substrate-binding protein [Candidatus Excrementavichristensenella sp.]|jgi:raffinose/stachyose/melibiose transport system substrate-binding protein
MKRILCLVLVLAAVLSACVSAEQKVVNFLHWRTEDVEVYNELIALFEQENPDIKIVMDVPTQTYEEYYTILKTRVMGGGEELDVFAVHPDANLSMYAKNGTLSDLSGLAVLPKLNKGMLDAGSVDGVLYAIPQALNLEGMIYNKKIFADNGLDVPETWTDFINCCEVLSKKGIAPISIGVGDKFPPVWLLIQFLDEARDWDWFKGLDTGDVLYTDEVFVEILTGIQQMEPYFVEGHEGTSYDQSITLFANEQAAMLVCGTWIVGQLAGLNPDLEFGNFTIPYPGDKYPTRPNLNPAQCFGVYSGSDVAEEARLFVNFLCDTPAMTIYGNKSIQAVVNMEVVLDIPALNDIVEQSKTGVMSNHYNTEVPKIEGLNQEIAARAALGDDVATILQEAQNELDLVIGR